MPKPIFWVYVVILQAVLKESSSFRRIKMGNDVTSDKRYAVYLLKTPHAPVLNRGWTCGGAIVSPSFVITAAACVEDVQRVYVIAGYRKFVTSKELEDDPCTSKMKKKVVLVSVPKEYHLKDYSIHEWARLDIGLVQVDTPFDFTDTSYETHCSYIPSAIDINYDAKYETPGTDTLIMGWGHAVQHKDDIELYNYNVGTLKYASTKILHMDTCLSYLPDNKKLHPIIRKFMICTLDLGRLNDRGQVVLRSPNIPDGCISKKDREMGKIGRTCEGEFYVDPDLAKQEYPSYIYNETKKFRRNAPDGNQSDKMSSGGQEPDKMEPDGNESDKTSSSGQESDKMEPDDRGADKTESSPGICQNDHGGPLVTWEGNREILIGVATMYKLDQQDVCIGPYMFTSTYCAGPFLYCMLEMDNDGESVRRCGTNETNRFEVEQRRISWHSEDWRIEKEVIRKRPQVPLSAFHGL